MSPKLLEQVQQTFSENFRKNKKISEIYKKIRSGSGTFRDAQEFARETGKALSDAYSSVIHGEDLPNGKMYYNIAQKVLQPTLSENFALATKVAGMVQESLNEQAGIGMKAVQPDLNQNRIDGILNRVSSEDNFDDVKWILGAPVETFTQSAIDDEIRVNAEFQNKAGMRPKIVRTMVGNCCRWCKALAGTYYYPDVPKDVFRRHNNCNCIVEYFPGDGKVQNAHSKVWYREEDRKGFIKQAKQQELRDQNSRNGFADKNAYTREMKKVYLSDATPGRGTINVQEGYDPKTHEEELVFSKWIHKTFGGDIVLQVERNQDHVMTADYLWNGALWDLKSASTAKAADSAIRKGIHQIEDNPGGVFLDYGENRVSIEEVKEVVANRLRRSSKEDVDVIIVMAGKIESIMRKR